MIRLSGPVAAWGLGPDVVVGQLTTDAETPLAIRSRRILLLSPEVRIRSVDGFAAVIAPQAVDVATDSPFIRQPEWATYLDGGDVVAITPTPSIHVLYRRRASTNSFLVTERCSSNCIMCSQPPKARDDSWLYNLAISAAAHLPDDTPEIGITGGEPLLDAQNFLTLIYRLKTLLPRTAVHVLSNGRLLSYLRYAQAISDIRHPDLMFGIPLYSANPARHDFVVQARGAFHQTVRGILNAKRCGIRVELRVVLHQQSTPTLLDLGRFITRHLPFVDQVALMGLEHIGYVKPNAAALKTPVTRHHQQISSFVSLLRAANVPVHLFNMPLCLLPEDAWRFARQSISDWKNDMPEQCARCAVQPDCCGFFSWNVDENEDLVKPFNLEQARRFRAIVSGRR